MYIIWDEKKARINLQKYGVSFDEARTVFYDPLAKITDDPDHSFDESRQIIIGHSKKANLLFVVHIYLENTETIRLISTRKATRKEKNDYMSLS